MVSTLVRFTDFKTTIQKKITDIAYASPISIILGLMNSQKSQQLFLWNSFYGQGNVQVIQVYVQFTSGGKQIVCFPYSKGIEVPLYILALFSKWNKGL